jgi:long-subunit fatty acid transport protein
MTLKKHLTTVALLFLVLLVCFPVSQLARFKPLYTYYNMFYGARSLGMGNAFTALADDLSAVFRNPAGVAELSGPQIFMDYRSDKINYDYAPDTLTTDSVTQEYDYTFQSTLKNADFFSVSAPVVFWDIKWSFALSYYRYIPYGFKGKGQDRRVGIDETLPDSYIMNIDGSGGLDVMALTGAFYLSDSVSFGVTVQNFFNSGEITYTQTPEGYGYTDQITDKLGDRNFIFGLLFKMMDNISLGISYNTQYRAKFTSQRIYQLDGAMEATTSDSISSVLIPAQLSYGLLLKPYKFMDITIDYTKQYWSKALIKDYYGQTDEIAFPFKDDFALNQKDFSALRFGTQIKIPLQRMTVFLRGGYSIDQQLFPDGTDQKVKLKGLSLGLGVNISKRVQLDAAYMRQKGTWNEASFLDPTAFISSTMTNKIFSLSLTLNFGAVARLP